VDEGIAVNAEGSTPEPHRQNSVVSECCSRTNQARFQNYLNLCLANKLKTVHSKRMKDSLCRPANLSLDSILGPQKKKSR
jgi:hypothetical protein